MNEVLLALLDPLDSPDAPDLRAPQDPLERKVDRARKDLKDQLEETVSRDQSVCRGPEDPQGPPERTETRARSESRVRREAKETKENMVHQVPPAPRGPSELRVQREQTVSPVPEVNRGCLVRKETKDPEASPDLQDPSDCRVFRVHLARKEKPETSVRWVHPALPVPGAPQDLPELTAPRDLQAASETPVLLERRETLVSQENLACREKSALRVREESEERRERAVRLELLDPPALKDPPEMTVPKEVQVQVVSPDTLVLLESPVLQD